MGLNFRLPNARFFGTVMHNWSTTRNFADSALSLPSDSNNPDVDWGPAAQDIRHRSFIHRQRAAVLRRALLASTSRRLRRRHLAIDRHR